MPGEQWGQQRGPIGFPPVQRPGGPTVPGYTPFDPQVPGGFPPFASPDACMEALRAILEETLLNAVAAPHHEPPFNARSIDQVARAVVNVPAGFDAAAAAGGVALAAAAGAIVAVPVLIPPNAVPPFGPVQVLQITTAPGFANVYRSVGVTVQNSSPEAARVSIDAYGPNSNPDGPSALTSSAQRLEQAGLLAIVPENRTLSVNVENLDTASAILVTVAVAGWSLPFTGYTDDLRGLYPKLGFGRNACRSWGRGEGRGRRA